MPTTDHQESDKLRHSVEEWRQKFTRAEADYATASMEVSDKKKKTAWEYRAPNTLVTESVYCMPSSFLYHFLSPMGRKDILKMRPGGTKMERYADREIIKSRNKLRLYACSYCGDCSKYYLNVPGMPERRRQQFRDRN